MDIINESGEESCSERGRNREGRSRGGKNRGGRSRGRFLSRGTGPLPTSGRAQSQGRTRVRGLICTRGRGQAQTLDCRDSCLTILPKAEKRHADVDYSDVIHVEPLEHRLHPKKPKTWPGPRPSASTEALPCPFSLKSGPTVSIKVSPDSTRVASQEPSSMIQPIPSHASDEEDDEETDYGFVAFNLPRQIPLDGTYDEEKVPQRPTTLPSPEGVPDNITLAPNDKFKFEWQPFPSAPDPPALRREQFNELSGPLRPFSTPYEAFTGIWNATIMGHIVSETNKYANHLAQEMMESCNIEPRSRITQWKDTNVDELFTYFAFIMAMGMCVKQSVKDYWSRSEGILSTPNFGIYMTYDRFLLLNRCLHFRDNDELAALVAENRLTVGETKIEKVKPIIDHLNSKFKEVYNLGRNITIDESLVQWKSWLQIKQYIKNKAANVGIKTYELCDSKNGYLWRFELYTGSDNSLVRDNIHPLERNVSKIVLRMIEGLEFSRRTVWMDNFYNSPCLARHLKSMGLDCVGTIRTNGQFVPDELKYLEKADMYVGEIAGSTSGDVDILVWRDKNRVPMISTYHGIAVSTTENKPVVVSDYNVCMGGVDRKDQLLSQYPIERKRTRVWYKKFFRRLLNASITNAYILYSETEGTSKLDHRNFRKNLISTLLERHAPQESTLVPLRCVSRSFKSALISVPIFGSEIKSHFPRQYPLYPGNKGERQRKTCVVCKKRSQTFCPGCAVPLCAFADGGDISCFLRHHS